ncbi:hypothetical protein N7539_003499 [Penicillium diatomitis]|uniref:Uncharacterized protein n=1 Tax=Penicillium diatomitis TaxID=2819901 RepID=A0A9X0BXL2_9EURO|nr:uncharacterized protein N7539_003499 [Penicillium diatomitis]KAJ5488609.1 hypothetical protein N7539_003499 [Penicillium diatomitis]
MANRPNTTEVFAYRNEGPKFNSVSLVRNKLNTAELARSRRVTASFSSESSIIYLVEVSS